VIDYELFCKQGDLFLGKRGGRAVAQVSDNGVTFVRELDAYLVPAPGIELYSNKSAALREIKHAERESRLPGLLGFFGRHLARPVFPPFDKIDQAA
jgi:hypothetical protein